jgi:hypothetical protein
MTMRVRLSEPAQLPDLVHSFLRNGCVAHTVTADSCVVVHVHASHADEALREISFFVRAWQLGRPGVATVVTTPAPS